MKKLLLMLFAFSLFTIGCSSDDNDSPQELLQNTWKPVKTIERESVNGGTPTVNTTNSTSCQQQTRITFNNGNGTFTEYDLATGGACQVVDSGSFTYSYDSNNKKLTIITADGSDVMSVKTLSSNELVFEWTETFTTQGQTYTYSEESYYVKAN